MKILNYTENSTYPPDGGHFSLAYLDRKMGEAESRTSEDDSLANKYGFWRRCLEECGNFFTQDCKSIVHCHNSDVKLTNNIRAFVSKVETTLNLSKKSEVFETNKKTITAVRVSPFWLNCPLKRRLFLLIVREGKRFVPAADGTYENQSFDIVYEDKNSYFNLIKPFFTLLLKGYTKFSKGCLDVLAGDFHRGIVFQFKNKTEQDILNNQLISKEN